LKVKKPPPSDKPKVEQLKEAPKPETTADTKKKETGPEV
jgi:hypothetical protein